MNILSLLFVNLRAGIIIFFVFWVFFLIHELYDLVPFHSVCVCVLVLLCVLFCIFFRRFLILTQNDVNYQTKKRICFSTNDHPTKLLQNNNNNLWCCSVILMVGDITEKRGSEQKKLKQKTKVGIGIFFLFHGKHDPQIPPCQSVSIKILLPPTKLKHWG